MRRLQAMLELGHLFPDVIGIALADEKVE